MEALIPLVILGLLLFLPLVWLIANYNRMVRMWSMSEYYGSFGVALWRDWWFSEGWWGYMRTLVALLVVGPVMMPEGRSAVRRA